MFPLVPILLALLLFPASIQAQDWELIWQDEFDYEGLPDSTRWGYDVGGHGWGNDEEQYYTETREKNARVENGHLIIEAHQEDYQGRSYTSTRLVTRNKGDWQYGRFEVRARLPGGRGTWPAIWMLPTEWRYGGWPASGEIDIMEYVGYQPGVVHGTVHTDAYNHIQDTQQGGDLDVEDAETTFHEYAVDWTPEKIDFFVDDTWYFTFRNEHRGWEVWPFDQPFHLLLNIAVGGSWGGVQGVDPDIWPQRLEVDYVRVYEDAGIPSVALEDVPVEPIEPGSSLTLSADATAPDGDVERVSFYQGDGLLGTDESVPYAVTVDDVFPGCYVVTAEVENGDWSVRSDADTIRVGDACGQAPYLMAPARLPGTLEAEYYDVGGAGVAYGDLSAENVGGAIRKDEGVDIEATDEPDGYYVGGIRDREWLAYTIEVEETGFYTLEARIASDNTVGAFALSVDGEAVADSIEFEPTGGEAAWDTVVADSIALEGGVYTLRVDMQDSGFNLDRLVFTRSSSSDARPAEVRETLALSGAPNPFTRTTTLSFTLPHAAPVRLDVYDVQGRHVTTLLDARRPAGCHTVPFDGSGLAGGTYFVRLATPAQQRVLPLVVLR